MARYFMWIGLVLGVLFAFSDAEGAALLFFAMAALNYFWSQEGQG